MEPLFYAVIALCGVLLALRVLIFVTRVYWNERPRSLPELAGGSESGQRMANVPDATAQRPTQAALSPGRDPSDAYEPGVRVRRRRSVLIFSGAFYSHGLMSKMMITFTAIIAAFGLLTITTVYLALSSSLRRHVGDRASLRAVNISDSVPAYLFRKDISSLRALLRKYASGKEVAYVLVENRAGKILAHSFAVLPEEIKQKSLNVSGSADKRRASIVERGAVYEVSAPVLDGQVGVVRLGLWRGAVDAEIFRSVIPLIKLISFITGVGILLAIFLVWKINRPILKLVNAAKSISTGDLDTPSLDVEDRTECGELSRALERLRSSVKAAMTRLSAER